MEENDEHTDGRTSAGGRQSILLNLKLSFETQSSTPKSKKSNKNCLDYLEKALFSLCLPLRVINGVKSLHKKKKET